MTRFAWYSLVAWTVLVTLPAAAQPGLAEARAHLDGARFAEAISSLDQLAASSAGLDERGIQQLFEIYALAAFGQRDEAAVGRALRSLLAIEPGAQLGDTAPPSLRRALEELRAAGVRPVGLEVDARSVDGGAQIEIRSIDSLGLVRRVRVMQQTGSGWQAFEGSSVRLEGSGILRYYAEAIGPGGARIARHASLDEPATVLAGVQLEPSLAEDSPVRETTALPAEGSDDSLLYGLAVAGSVLVVAAVLTAVLAAVLPGDLTRPGRLMEIP